MLQGFLFKTKSVLVVLSITLIAANIYLLVTTKELAKSYTNQQNEAQWFLYQLVKEFTELTAISSYSYLPGNKKEDVILHYKLTWSRFDILLSSRESRTFVTEHGYKDFFSRQFANFKQIEPYLAKVSTQYEAEQLSTQLNAIYAAVTEFISHNYRLNSPKHLARVEQVNTLTVVQLLLLAAMLICTGLISYIFYREASHHRKLSRTDSLTGIPNRLAFVEALKNMQKNSEFTLLILDLNGFKEINDSHGHQAGDETLVQIATRLLETIQPYDAKVYRMGGDEFSILIASCHHYEINPLLSHIDHCFNQSVWLEEGTQVKVGTSIGIARYPLDSDDIEQLLTLADQNMYEMKFARPKAFRATGSYS